KLAPFLSLFSSHEAIESRPPRGSHEDFAPADARLAGTTWFAFDSQTPSLCLENGMKGASKTENKNSWLPEGLTTMAVPTGVGYLAVAYSVSRWLPRSTQRPPKMTPTDLGLPWEPLECRTADRIRLVGWLVEPRNPFGTVALFHGMRHNREKM